MWAMLRKPKPRMVETDNPYNLTAEERHYVASVFKLFTSPEGRHIGQENHPPAIRRGLVALGLWQCAEQKMATAEFYSRSPYREAFAKQAIVTIKKAYAIHQLPIYLFDLACYLKAAENISAARCIYRAFLQAQELYNPGEFDFMFLSDRDIGKAIHQAQEGLKNL